MQEAELAALGDAIDKETGGALYALRYECDGNGWTAHLWAQTPDEGAPCGMTRLMFLGCSSIGKTMYWDSVLVRDTTGMASKIKHAAFMNEAREASERIRDALERLTRGLNPVPPRVPEIRSLN